MKAPFLEKRDGDFYKLKSSPPKNFEEVLMEKIEIF